MREKYGSIDVILVFKMIMKMGLKQAFSNTALSQGQDMVKFSVFLFFFFFLVIIFFLAKIQDKVKPLSKQHEYIHGLVIKHIANIHPP